MAKTDKREDIMRAALELMAEQGFHGAPMAMVADRARVGAGTIYRYFENKDVLIAELYRDLKRRIYEVILQRYAPDESIRERLFHLATALLRYFTEHPLDFRFLEQFHNSPYGAEFRRDLILGKKDVNDPFRQLLEEGISRQVLKDLPLILIFALMFGPLLAVARDHVLGFITLDEALILRTIEACWDGIKR
jgi:AcrR family transcriptional regulator